MNTKWSEDIRLDRPLNGVFVVAGAPTECWDTVIGAKETAAYKRGREDCQRELLDHASQRTADLTQQHQAVLNALRQALPQVVCESESALIDLALEAARRVVAGIQIDAPMVEAVVREALRQAQDTAEILVQLHPADLALLRAHDAELLKGVPDKGPLRFLASNEVSRGGCVVQTRFGLIDARREVKLDQLAESLRA